MNEIQTRDERPPLVVLRQRLEDRRTELRNALVDVTPDQFIRAVCTAAQINPDLQAVTWPSLWNACLRACRDNLLPDGVDGAIVPYKDKASWIPMVGGLMRRFRRSGQFRELYADCVRDGDEFRYYVDETGPHLYHEPRGDFEAEVVKVYALATTKDGGRFVAVLPIAEVNKIRKMSRASRSDSPWQLWPEEMMKKTAIRRLSKILPSGRDLMPDDDDDLPDAPSPPLSPKVARAPGAAAALETFAASEPAPIPVTPAGEEGGDQAAVENQSANMAADRAPDAVNQYREAYERGAADKAAGHARRAIPGEYRENTRLALCWQAGFDGSPAPSFATEG